jgi:GNAT superfamily N-acetyltransferase
MPNVFDDDPLAGSAAPASPLRITVHPSWYYDNIKASTNDAQGSDASTQAPAPGAATVPPNAMFGTDTPWWLNPSATTVQSPGLTDDDLSAETSEQSPAQAQAAADVRDWLAQKIALGEAPREWHSVMQGASDATGHRDQTAPNGPGPKPNIGSVDAVSAAAWDADAARRLDDWVALKAPNGPPHSDWAIWRRARDGFVGGFGDRPLGLPLEERARYPVSEMLQPFAAPVDFAARLLPAGIYGAAGLIAGAYEDSGGSPASANGLQRDFGVAGQYPFIEGPALPRPTYWPPLRRSAPRSPVDRSPSADPRNVDVNQPREAAPQPSSPNAQAADQSARPILIPSERNPVTGTDEKPVGRSPLGGKDVQPDTGGSDFQDLQTLDAWPAHAANVVRGRDDGGATGAPAPARRGAARFEAPASEASRPWYGATEGPAAAPPPSMYGESNSRTGLRDDHAQLVRDYLGLEPNEFNGTVSVGPDQVSIIGKILGKNGAEIGEVRRGIVPGTNTAYHENLRLKPSARGQGIWQKILSANVKFYEQHGVDRIEVSAKDVGGYLWARSGFVPELSSWLKLREKIKTQLDEARIDGLPDVIYNDVKGLLESSNPRSIWQIADNRYPVNGVELGKVLLNDTEWYGSFSLKDPAMMRRFKYYVARSSTP